MVKDEATLKLASLILKSQYPDPRGAFFLPAHGYFRHPVPHPCKGMGNGNNLHLTTHPEEEYTFFSAFLQGRPAGCFVTLFYKDVDVEEILGYNFSVIKVLAEGGPSHWEVSEVGRFM